MEGQRAFALEGARNVFLETVKRGEYDDYSAQSSNVAVVLRMYEAYGGHAQATLRVGSHIPVARAYVTNLLEDETEELQLLRVEDDALGGATLKLTFHAFEVKTVKLVIGKATSVDEK